MRWFHEFDSLILIRCLYCFFSLLPGHELPKPGHLVHSKVNLWPLWSSSFLLAFDSYYFFLSLEGTVLLLSPSLKFQLLVERTFFWFSTGLFLHTPSSKSSKLSAGHLPIIHGLFRLSGDVATWHLTRRSARPRPPSLSKLSLLCAHLPCLTWRLFDFITGH